MATQDALVDRNNGRTLIVESSTVANEIVRLKANPTTGAVLTETTGSTSTAGTGTKSNVSGSASSVTLLAANTSRKRYHLFNDSAAKCYVDVTGGTASATSFTFILEPYTGSPAFNYFESPSPVNTSAITGIWASATGTMRVVEFA